MSIKDCFIHNYRPAVSINVGTLRVDWNQMEAFITIPLRTGDRARIEMEAYDGALGKLFVGSSIRERGFEWTFGEKESYEIVSYEDQMLNVHLRLINPLRGRLPYNPGPMASAVADIDVYRSGTHTKPARDRP